MSHDFCHFICCSSTISRLYCRKSILLQSHDLKPEHYFITRPRSFSQLSCCWAQTWDISNTRTQSSLRSRNDVTYCISINHDKPNRGQLNCHVESKHTKHGLFLYVESSRERESPYYEWARLVISSIERPKICSTKYNQWRDKSSVH